MMKLQDLMKLDLLDRMIKEGYISAREHPEIEGMTILHYTSKAIYKNIWNDATLNCRGLIVSGNRVVARPWKKFYNWGEKAVAIGSDDPVEITDKLDGSLGIGYVVNGRWHIATKGSFDGQQARWASDWILWETWVWCSNPTTEYTPLFEIVYPQNRIVLDYGDREELVLLGCVGIETGFYYGPTEAAGLLGWPGATTPIFPEKTLGEFWASANTDRVNAEGVVVRSGNRMVKVKQDSYARMHAVLTNMSNVTIWTTLSEGHGLPDQPEFVPDEFYAWMVTQASALEEAHATWLAEVDKEYRELKYDRVANEKKDRRNFAEAAKKSPHAAALFKLYENQPIDELAWRAVRPTVIEKPFDGRAGRGAL